MKTTIGFIFLAGATMNTANISNCPANLLRTYKLHQFEGSCYEFHTGKNSQLNWGKATLDCGEKKGRLVDINTKAEQDFIISTLKDIRDPFSDGERLWLALLKDRTTEWKWGWYKGKTEIDFQNWAPFQPRDAANGKEDEHCGLMALSGEWHEYPCEDKNDWICEYSTTSNFDCPANLQKSYNLLQWRDHCYLFLFDNLQHWHYADRVCRTNHGYLVDIHSQEEQNFIFNAWIKLRFKSPYGKGLWIGLTDDQNYYQEGQWNWTSNEKQLDYQNWNPGQPESPGDLEDCALMVWNDFGKWHDYPCDEEEHHYGFICKFRRDN